MSINKVILIGNVGTDPEIRNTNDGREIASFSLATSESWKDKNSGEKKEKTEWHRLVVFSQGLVGIVKNYVKKGSKLYIEGQLQTRKWTDKDGADKYTTEIVLQGFNSTIQLVGGKGLQDAGIDKALDVVDKSKTNGFQSEDDMDDFVPF
jgi:single-strand DNA-binding protein|tara:strand:- start:363 stop:812 length:450 start_codon:yes stop_codon:yes gene_type:complete